MELSPITLLLDFDENRVEVEDTGVGFPNDPSLMILGGTSKPPDSGKRLFGLVGVGVKVVLFSSSRFVLRARVDGSAHRHQLLDAYRFMEETTHSASLF